MLSNPISEPTPAQSDALLCPSCKKENKPNVSFCAFCGLSLAIDSTTTVIVPPKPIEMEETTHLTNLIQLHNDALVLYIVGRKQPMLVHSDKQITLGRVSLSPSDEKPDIDFTEYDAHILGVSRKHATIFVEKDGYSIEDLDSPNGTFINETRIAPSKRQKLVSGDLLRLGQFVIYIYFNRGEQVAQKPKPRIGERAFYLLEKGDTTDLTTAEGVSVHYLDKRIMPYLRAISELQAVIDAIMERVTPRMEVRGITIDRERKGVKINIHAYPEAMQHIYHAITPWKQTRNRLTLQEADVKELVTAMVKKVVPETMPSEKRDAYQERLMPYVHTMCISSLEFTMK